MQLSVYTDYALRLMMRLALSPDRLVTIQEVADDYGISRNHLMKIAVDLGRHGYVESVRGRAGMRLAMPPRQINLGEVVRKTEENLRIVECFDQRRDTCVISGVCGLRGVLAEATDAFLAVLDRHTLRDLMREPHMLGRVFEGRKAGEATRGLT